MRSHLLSTWLKSQKKGYGKKLLNKILSECKAPYCLAVYEENRNAYRFYENFGLKVAPY
ncbi:GNAT family N-acetyltransferase [Nostoc sp.]|uniref:GNAT family N-acetyltransferase n=1 Tax=Nostoc sp. TaxID=1180 RepID=UPI003FA53DFA